MPQLLPVENNSPEVENCAQPEVEVETKNEPEFEAPTVTFPFPRTLKSSAPVEEATVNNFVKGDDAVEVETASCENGVVVPMPIAEVVADCPPKTWVHAS